MDDDVNADQLASMGFEIPDDVVMVTASPDQLAVVNPFGDRKCSVVTVTSDVNVSQLTDEIVAATGMDVQAVLTRSQDGIDRLFVCPPVEMDALGRIIAGHKADPRYGMSEERRAHEELIDKLKMGEPISQEEMAQALLYLSQR